MRAGLAGLTALALALAGCAHAAAMRYTFRPCNAAFQGTVAACFHAAGAPWDAFSYDFYADSGMVEKRWRAQYESCMFRRGYSQIGDRSGGNPRSASTGPRDGRGPMTRPRAPGRG